MRIAVYGAGAVGGYFGGRLALGGADVHLIARGAHLDALRSDGLRVRGVTGDFDVRIPATGDPRDIGPCDAVLFCVKSYDTDDAAARLPPLLHDTTAVVTLQNGVDNEERIAAAVGDRHVVGGAAFVFARVAEPGVIENTGGPGSILFGELDGSSSERCERLLAACRAAGFPAEAVSDIRAQLWQKFAFICAQAGLTAATRTPIGVVRRIPESLALFRRVLEEVQALAAAEGVALPSDMVERLLGFVQALVPTAYSSLHNDLAAGRRNELESLHGFVVRRAGEHGLAVPACEALYAILRPYAAVIAEAGEAPVPSTT